MLGAGSVKEAARKSMASLGNSEAVKNTLCFLKGSSTDGRGAPPQREGGGKGASRTPGTPYFKLERFGQYVNLNACASGLSSIAIFSGSQTIKLRKTGDMKQGWKDRAVVLGVDEPFARDLGAGWLQGEPGHSTGEVVSRLLDAGLKREDALLLLAHVKSEKKYRYPLDVEASLNLIGLMRANPERAISTIIENPFVLVKVLWLYEHAPFFLIRRDEPDESEREEFILGFSDAYRDRFLAREFSADRVSRNPAPKRLFSTWFWDSNLWHPGDAVIETSRKGLEGLEMSADFHPFNPGKLLPEELDRDARSAVRELVEATGVLLSIHSPIVGPYIPSPDPSKGKQSFYDPAKNMELMLETIDLARDLGATSVVIHLIDYTKADEMAELVRRAEGSPVRVTFENYCETATCQTTEEFVDMLGRIRERLPQGVAERNMGVTFDVGHINIEGEDPLAAVVNVGKWCLENRAFLRLHATDNYGSLHFSPPNFSADVHSAVTGRGINNRLVIRLLKSMGINPEVVAEQIQPLRDKDIEMVHSALVDPIESSYEEVVARGEELLSGFHGNLLITDEKKRVEGYKFVAGFEGVDALKEHLLFRQIQDKKHISTEEAKRASLEIMHLPLNTKIRVVEYIDDLLIPVQHETGAQDKRDIDLVCQNICGSLIGAINNRHLGEIFSIERRYDRGEVICSQDTIGQEMYFIKSGSASVDVNGSRVAVLRKGELFGEISLFYNVKRTATVVAQEDGTTVGLLTRNRLEKLIHRTDVPAARALIYRLFRFLPQRLRNLNRKYFHAATNLMRLISDKKAEDPLTPLASMELGISESFRLGLTEEEIQELFSERIVFPAGSTIVEEGAAPNGAYLIVRGKVKIVAIAEDKEVPLADLKEGQIFGEMSLIDLKPRSASAVADTEVELGFISKERFEEIIEARTELTFRLMSSISLSLLRHIQRLDRMYIQHKEIITGSSHT